jgi:hypothetical protein
MKLHLKLIAVFAVSLASLWASAHSTEQHTVSARSLSVKPFNEGTWATLIKSGPKPAAYMFTTTYCSACPAVFQEVREATSKSKSRPELIVILMDAEGPNALRHASHFKGMTQLFSFDGYEPAIRSAVDPTWRNITPYVVLVDRHGGIQRGVGSPTAQSLKQWLQ